MLDLVAAGLAVLALIKGFRNGLIVAVFSFVGWLVGLFAAIQLSALAAGWLQQSVNLEAQWIPPLAFLLVFLLTVLLIRMGANLLEGMAEMALLGWLNKLLGILLYLLLYALILSVFLFYASRMQLLSAATLEQSLCYRWIQPLAPFFLNNIGSLLPFAKAGMEDLETFFEAVRKAATP